MTLVIGEQPLDTSNAVLFDSVHIDETKLQPRLNEKLSEPTDVELMQDKIRRELGKLAPVDCVVVKYDVEGRQSFCSPVRGVIKAVLYNQKTNESQEDATLFTTNARERFDDVHGLIAHLNEIADANRASKTTPHKWQHDK